MPSLIPGSSTDAALPCKHFHFFFFKLLKLYANLLNGFEWNLHIKTSNWKDVLTFVSVPCDVRGGYAPACPSSSSNPFRPRRAAGRNPAAQPPPTPASRPGSRGIAAARSAVSEYLEKRKNQKEKFIHFVQVESTVSLLWQFLKCFTTQHQPKWDQSMALERIDTLVRGSVTIRPSVRPRFNDKNRGSRGSVFRARRRTSRRSNPTLHRIQFDSKDCG